MSEISMTRKRNTDVMHSMAGKSDIFICVVDNLMRLINELINRFAWKANGVGRIRSAAGGGRHEIIVEMFLILLRRDMYGDILGLLPRVLPAQGVRHATSYDRRCSVHELAFASARTRYPRRRPAPAALRGAR
ncbi:hypothetical protein PCAR4_450022 [Paraburkholderia caribensis]|nr:hypothetical protein PCAR4_450022 [Paraburkholderia caribensis]